MLDVGIILFCQYPLISDLLSKSQSMTHLWSSFEYLLLVVPVTGGRLWAALLSPASLLDEGCLAQLFFQSPPLTTFSFFMFILIQSIWLFSGVPLAFGPIWSLLYCHCISTQNTIKRKWTWKKIKTAVLLIHAIIANPCTVFLHQRVY